MRDDHTRVISYFEFWFIVKFVLGGGSALEGLASAIEGLAWEVVTIG